MELVEYAGGSRRKEKEENNRNKDEDDTTRWEGRLNRSRHSFNDEEKLSEWRGGGGITGGRAAASPRGTKSRITENISLSKIVHIAPQLVRSYPSSTFSLAESTSRPVVIKQYPRFHE